MSEEKVRIPLADGQALAAELLAVLDPLCDRIEIAGSIRRRKETIGDVELVCVPKTEWREAGLFGETVPVNLEFELLHKLRAEGVFVDRLNSQGSPCFGPRFQRVLFGGFPVDVFCVLPPAEWGVIFTLRTGPETFSRRLVTSSVASGYGRLPMGMQVKDGALYDRGTLIPTPTEESFFEAINYPYRDPWDRF